MKRTILGTFLCLFTALGAQAKSNLYPVPQTRWVETYATANGTPVSMKDSRCMIATGEMVRVEGLKRSGEGTKAIATYIGERTPLANECLSGVTFDLPLENVVDFERKYNARLETILALKGEVEMLLAANSEAVLPITTSNVYMWVSDITKAVMYSPSRKEARLVFVPECVVPVGAPTAQEGELQNGDKVFRVLQQLSMKRSCPAGTVFVVHESTPLVFD